MSSPAEPCLSVVMPCYNEAGTVRAVIERVLQSPYVQEVIVIDDASTDGTGEIVRDIADQRVFLHVQDMNQGKGAALRRGFAECSAQYVIIQDADLEYDPGEFGTLLEPLLHGWADVVYGSRFHTSRPHRVLYFWHALGNKVLTAASNMFTNVNLSDMETCYKAFRREVLESIDIEEDRFGVEPEITAKVAKGGWRIYEVGISYFGRTYDEGKKITWKDGVQAFYCVVRYSRLGERLRRRRSRRRRAPARFDTAEAELVDVLHSLEKAHNYADWIYALMKPYLGHEVLEIGAGEGFLTGRLSEGRRVLATEVSGRCVETLRRQYGSSPNVLVEHADFEDSCGAAGMYDSIVLVNVLEHIEDDEKALRQMAQALKPGGHLLLFVPAFQFLYSEFDRRIGHYRRYRLSSLRRKVAGVGLEPLEACYVNSLGAFAWWLFAKILRQTPTHGWSVLLYDRVAVPLLRRVEAVSRPPFGQSVFCASRRPVEGADPTGQSQVTTVGSGRTAPPPSSSEQRMGGDADLDAGIE